MTDKSKNNQPKADQKPEHKAEPQKVEPPKQDQKTEAPQKELTPLEAAQKQVAELTDMLKRNQAEFQNYQKRQEQQSRQMVMFSTQRVVTKLIPIIDMFELSLKHKDKVEEFITGVEMIHQSFVQLLSDEQVIVPELIGKKFDPKLAKAIGTKYVKGVDENTVIEVVSKCYMIEDRVIKHANVIVSAAADSSAGQSKK
ncbi:MAG TPA: nucleotide exchange factor GrpE [Acidobacteriota bacterium]|nr:nucleotide exchange factor GrpE [Acidobacteriota bacterium]